jgi:DNA-binding transcriptional regulator YhcF (GntR family)
VRMRGEIELLGDDLGERYEEWDVSIPPLPPRSRLYRLEPIGIGTPYVESLTSYIMRLAAAHCVTPQALVQREIFPVWNQAGAIQNTDSWLGKFWWASTPVLNGISSNTMRWVSVLQALTSCDNLCFLTMLTWSEVIGNNKLLRRKKAWCPRCFQEWRQNRQVVYEPLLWTLNAIDICSSHQQSLIALCQHCQETQPFLKQASRPGYCSHCVRWLGNNVAVRDAETMRSNIERVEISRWQARVIGEMLAAAPTLSGLPSKGEFTDAFNRYLVHYADGRISVLAHILKISTDTLRSYLRRDHVASLDSLLQLCHGMSITPLQFLTESPTSSRSSPHFVLDHVPVLFGGERTSFPHEDIGRMRQALEAVLDIDEENPFPFPALRRIAQRLGYRTATLRKHCPDLCQAIIMRSRWTPTGNDALKRMRQALEGALDNDERMPLKAIARELGCSNDVLYKRFPDLSRAVVTRYRGERIDKEQIRQQLQDMLTSTEKMPSIREIARQRGYSLAILENDFPDLCKEIALRRRSERRKQHEERMTRISMEIRQAVMVLHQQGIYPSSIQVGKQLNNSHILWPKEPREAWISALDELGYPTDHLKKYT